MSLELLILGSNSASFSHKRHHTSQLLKVQNRLFLIDCGEGTQQLLKKYKVKHARIDHICISHLHGDHYFGLIGLLSTMHLFGRTRDLHLTGPPGLSDIIQLQFKHSNTQLNFKIIFTEYTPETSHVVYEDDRMTVTTIPLEHRVPCSGYLFKEKPKRRRINGKYLPKDARISPSEINRLKNGEDILDLDGNIKYENKLLTLDPYPQYSYAFCSDTRYISDLHELVSDVNTLYHEATFAEDMAERAEQTFHSTAKQAAQVAKDAKVGRLLVGHFSSRYKDLKPILDDARSVFPRTQLAIEGKIFEIR